MSGWSGISRVGVLLVGVAMAGLTGCITPSPGPGPNPGPVRGDVLFFDDFAGGFDPAWSKTTGWEVQSGLAYHRYDGTGRGYAYVIPGRSWRNYAVETTLNPQLSRAGIVVRCQDNLMSFVLVSGDTRSLRCQVFVNGSVVTESEAVTPGFFDGNQQVVVTAHGATYEVYVNGLLRLVFVDDTLSQGMPGMASFGNWVVIGRVEDSGAAFFDTFRVVELK